MKPSASDRDVATKAPNDWSRRTNSFGETSTSTKMRADWSEGNGELSARTRFRLMSRTRVASATACLPLSRSISLRSVWSNCVWSTKAVPAARFRPFIRLKVNSFSCEAAQLAGTLTKADNSLGPGVQRLHQIASWKRRRERRR